ncbi:GntR family transcriptional regulator [Patulibacter americanus]|uniref:GntR family transcriptional regulator n=1 Tax=Patulibacter americanus TaxID=588672 RepID=UPI0003B6042B|nr:GntR family transcriptional regulator [Patulibacter americanus]
MPPVKPARQTKQERVYVAVRERIVSGQYGPGFRVVIDTIAEEFGVSALPVREAIRRLEAEGLVVYRPNAGAQVAPAEPAVFEEEMSVLAVLEGYATALAAPLLTQADLTRLDATTDEMVEAMEAMDALSFGRLNQQFHQVFHERCPNPSLVRMVRDVNDRLAVIRQTVFVQIPYRGRASVEEHRALVALLRDGADATAIETAAREHKLHTVASFHDWKARNGG